MHRIIGVGATLFLYIVALVLIKALDPPVPITVILVIPASVVALTGMLSLSVGKSPKNGRPNRHEKGRT